MSGSRRGGLRLEAHLDFLANREFRVGTHQFRAERRSSRTAQRNPGNRRPVRQHGHVVPRDGSAFCDPYLPTRERDRGGRRGLARVVRLLAESVTAENAAAVVVRKPAVQYFPFLARDSGEPLAGRGVVGRIEDDVGVGALDHDPGPVPQNWLDFDARLDPKRPRRSIGVGVALPKAEVDVIIDPRREEARPDHLSERVADPDSVAGFDTRFDVEHPREVVAGVHHDEVVVRNGVGFRRRGDGPGGDDLARDRTRRVVGVDGIVAVGSVVGLRIQVDCTPLVVGDVGGVVQREPGVAFEHPRGNDDHRSHFEPRWI